MFLSSFNRRQKLTVCVFAIVNFFSAICVSLQAPFYPEEAEKKGATATQYGLVFGIFELTVFIVSPIVGKNLSKMGAKRVFNAGIFLTGTCSILFGLLDQISDKTTFIVLSFVTRSIEAVGNSGFLTASFSIIAQEFPEKVAFMFACMETCFGLGLIVGPSVGGALYQAGGYSLPFVVMGLLLVLAACFTLVVLPAHYNQNPNNERADKGLCAILSVPTIMLAAYNVFCASVSLGFLQTTLEPHLRQFGLKPLTMGSMFVVNGGSYALTAPLWGWLCDKKIDPRAATAIGAGNVIIAFLFLGPAPFFNFPTNLNVCIITLVVHGVGFSAALVSGFALAHREAVAVGFPNNMNTYALISSLWTSVFALGAFVGPSVAGVLVDNFSFGWSSMFVVVISTSVFFVSTGFICFIEPSPAVDRPRRTNIEDDEARPLLDMSGSGDRQDRSQNGSLLSVPLRGSDVVDDGHGQERAQSTRVPRSRAIFSPFVSPIESMSMMSMMGCSMPAASQTNSLFTTGIDDDDVDEDEIIVESMLHQRPVRRGEAALRPARSARTAVGPLRTSQSSSQSRMTLDDSTSTVLSSDKESPTRIQVRAMIEERRSHELENAIG